VIHKDGKHCERIKKKQGHQFEEALIKVGALFID